MKLTYNIFIAFSYIFIFFLISCSDSSSSTNPNENSFIIQDQINNATSNATINIPSGTYHENIVIEGKTIHLKGESPTRTIIDGGNLGHVISYKPGTKQSIPGGSISGLTIKNSGSGETDCGISIVSGEVEIYSNILEDNNNGIGAHQGAKLNIYNNFIHNNAGIGIGSKQDSELTISNNIVINNSTGIGIEESSLAKLISYNTIYKNNVSGISLKTDNTSDNVINNNIITDNLSAGISVDNGLIVNDYNNVFNNKTDYKNCSKGQHGISVDAMFKDITNNNFHLNTNSTCLNASDNNSEIGAYGGTRPFSLF